MVANNKKGTKVKGPTKKKTTGNTGGNQKLAAQVALLAKRINAVAKVKNTVPVRNAAQLRAYNALVADPWNAPAVGGVAGSGNHAATIVAKLRNVVSVLLPEPGSYAAEAGLDIFVPLLSIDVPHVVIAKPTGSGGAAWSTITVQDYAKPATTTLPTGGAGRLVAGAVRIIANDSGTNAGGTLYAFNNSSAAGGTDHASPDLTWGYVAGDLTGSIGRAQFQSGAERTFIATPGTEFFPLEALAATPSTVPAIPGMRFWFMPCATARSFTFEIVANVEYYHDSHRHMAAAVNIHPDGASHVSDITNFLNTEQSGNSVVTTRAGHSKLERTLHRITGVAHSAEKVIEGVGNTLYKGKKVYDWGKKALGYAEGAALMLA